MDLLRAAAAYIDLLGIRLVVADAEKVPFVDYFPSGASSATKNLAKIRRALDSHPGATIAARVGHDYTVLDVDTRRDGHASLKRVITDHFGALPETWTVETPTGGRHYWFAGVGFDTRGTLANGCEIIRGNRLITLPPSRRAGGQYRWLAHPLRTALADVPDWMQRAIELEPTQHREHDNSDIETRVKRAKAWIAKADPAISGQDGARTTMYVASRIVRGFDLPQDRALEVMQDWNQSCVPPWSDYELKRKIRDAYKRGRMEWGAMLRARELRAA